jgi:hypothetical protein
LTVVARGNTAVGNSGSATGNGAGFNNNSAAIDVSINSTSVFSACSGYGCVGPASFSGTRTAYVLAYSGNLDTPSEHRVALTSSVSTNSNYEYSFAHAYVDPIIAIDPAFLAAHPGLTLSFSAGVPVPAVPLPASAWLLLGGMLGLIEVRRRQGQPRNK